MGKLIDADKLKRKCQKTATEAWKMKIKAPIETTLNQFIDWIDQAEPVDALPPAQPTLYGYDIKHLAFIAAVMEKEGMSPEEVVAIFRDLNRVIEMMLEGMEETRKKALEQWEGAKDGNTWAASGSD